MVSFEAFPTFDHESFNGPQATEAEFVNKLIERLQVPMPSFLHANVTLEPLHGDFEGYPTEVLYVLIVLMAIAIQYLLTIHLYTVPARLGAFSKEFMGQFNEVHQEAYPGKNAP